MVPSLLDLNSLHARLHVEDLRRDAAQNRPARRRRRGQARRQRAPAR